MIYTTKNIDKKLELLEKEYKETSDKKEQEKISNLYNELNTRAIINSYLIYGNSMQEFIDNKYSCSENLDIEKLWKEQVNCLGNL